MWMVEVPYHAQDRGQERPCYARKDPRAIAWVQVWMKGEELVWRHGANGDVAWCCQPSSPWYDLCQERPVRGYLSPADFMDEMRRHAARLGRLVPPDKYMYAMSLGSKSLILDVVEGDWIGDLWGGGSFRFGDPPEEAWGPWHDLRVSADKMKVWKPPAGMKLGSRVVVEKKAHRPVQGCLFGRSTG